MSIDPTGRIPAETRAAAAYYLARGRLPVPVPRLGRCKAPLLEGWQNLRPTPEDLDGLFPAGKELNVGLLLGTPSHGLIDVDLDAIEAVAAGALLLPCTGWISGRESKARSHWWYAVDDPPDQASEQFRDLDQSMLLELRGTGGQTVAPPGVHESGEPIVWHEFTASAHVALADLRRAVARTAAAALLARHWPEVGGRQNAALALAGGLAKAGWEPEAVEKFVRAIATAAADEEAERRCKVADRSAVKIAAGRKAWGWPKLAEFLGEQGRAVVGRVREWLGLPDDRAAGAATQKTPVRKEWTEAEIAPEVREAYEKLLRQLRDLQLDKGRDGEKEPFAVRLTPEAKELWVRFYQEWAAAQASVEGDLAAAYSKLEGYAARLALLHHVVRRVGDMEDCQPIEAASMEAGVLLARWFAYEARRIYVTLSESEDQRATRRLIEFIRSHGGRTAARRLHLSNKSRYPDAAALGFPLDDTDDDALAGIDRPLAALLRDYRSAAKRASTYGPAGPKGYREGRIFAQWKQIGCVTGRMACTSPNLQNLPADVRYRRCFAAPPGRVLIKADYSQIELRIAAKISGDAAMLRAYAEGLDLHTLTAQRMLGKDDVTPLERKLAKPVNFGLICGLGVTSLRKKAKADYGLDLSPEDAAHYRDAFFAAYPGVARWHGRIRAQRATETRTLARRRCLVEADGFYGGKANYAVRGTGSDGFKAALGLLWERHGDIPDAFPVAVVHDLLRLARPRLLRRGRRGRRGTHRRGDGQGDADFIDRRVAWWG